jgi:hypothetical protein
MTRLRQIRFWLLASIITAGSLRCAGDNLGPPNTLEKVAGDGQSGGIGQALPAPLVVEVTDGSGNGVAGVTVTWAVQGGGSVSAQTVQTGSDGRASVQRVLGPQLGQQTTTATAGGVQGSPVTFVATAVASGPGVTIVTQPPPSALSGEVFDPANQPVVSVGDASGNPMAGTQVTATIGSGGGTLEGQTTATTDANGVAKFGDLGISGAPGDNTISFTAGSSSATSSAVAISALPPEAASGAWGPVVNWDIVPLHMALMPNGKVFAWGKRDVADTMGMPRIWDPSAGAPSGLSPINVADMLFCAGLTLLPDGQTLMLAGGHHMDDAGIKATYLFSKDGAPSKGPDMAFGRWYPTLTVLPDGRILSMAGRDATGAVVKIPEVWDGTGWTQLSGASSVEIPYYPRNFVAPDGRIFYAGERVMSRWFNYSGSGSWSNGPTHIWPFNREYGSAVMYEAGKILYVGGGGDRGWGQNPDALSTRASAPTATAEKIDLNAGTGWQPAGSMSVPRRHLNATILPDGKVLVTGGTTGGGFDDINLADAALNAELWDPKVGSTGQWTTLARAANIPRVYHSVSLLMPDGTVLHGASGNAQVFQGSTIVDAPDEKSHQIFSPPYLFKGARPVITSISATSVGYNQTFSITTPNAAQITEVRWIRLGAVTHAFDQSQRANILSFAQTSTGVDVTTPANGNLAPPGPYLVFILNRNGVPSTGTVVNLR